MLYEIGMKCVLWCKFLMLSLTVNAFVEDDRQDIWKLPYVRSCLMYGSEIWLLKAGHEGKVR